MAALKCKICGGSVLVDTVSGIYTCEFCGTKQTLPLFLEDSERLLYESGNNYLLHSEYDKAEAVFNQLLTIKKDAPELYWDLVLCKYGVTYVKDPKTDKYVPTCNRTHYTSIFSDPNYKKAIELSTGEKKALFEEDANTIDAIQKGIIAVSKKEKPFDIFISYKETDADGNRTRDSVEAQKLYEKLTDAGYKVFFSRITLEDKIGAEYEPYIYAALHSSRVMLTVGSSKENLEAVWVKNEWSRFLSIGQGDTEKALIPLYFDMDRTDLPEEFAILPAQDMQKEGFEQELLRGIKKLIPVSLLKAKRRKDIFRAAVIGFLSIVLVAGIAALIVVPKAMEDKKLREEAAAREEAYKAALAQFDSRDYAAAAKGFTDLGDYKDAEQQLERCALQPKYDAAMALYEKGNYWEAAQAFADLGDYEEAAQMKEKAETAHAEEVQAREYEAAMQLYYDSKYAAAAWAFGDMGDYKDAAQMQKKAQSAWRDQLSGVAVELYGYENPLGLYYISPNGEVKNHIKQPGNANDGIEIGRHGKIVSITADYPLCALYEDGYVHNSAQNNGMNADWEDVIQVTPRLFGNNVALKTDGTVVFGTQMDHSWLTPAGQWKNIVSLSWCCFKGGREGSPSVAVLAGVDIHGQVHCVYTCDENYVDTEALQVAVDAVEALTNVESVAFYAQAGMSFSKTSVYFAALNGENQLIYYRDGVTDTLRNVSYKTVGFRGTELFALDQKGTVQNLDKKKAVAEDVVYMDPNGFWVKRSGIIVDVEEKTQVRDVWLEGNG